MTGTLWSGHLRTDSEVALYPGNRSLRVRGLQVHGGSIEQAHAGQRTAVNLAGIEAAEIERGMVLAPPGLFEATTIIDSRFELLASALPLKHRAPVHFHAGTAAIEAEARLLGDVGKPIQPGETSWLRLLLKSPLLLLPGDRFILRMFSPVVTIGGGFVVDNAPPPRWRRAQIVDRLPQLSEASLAERVRMHALETADGVRVASLAARCGVSKEQILAVGVSAGCLLVRDPEPRLIPDESFAAQEESLRSLVASWHKDRPLEPGMPRRAIPHQPWLVEAILAAKPERFVAESDLVRLRSHTVALQGSAGDAAAKLEKVFLDAGYAVPSLAEALTASGMDAGKARTLLDLLVRQGTLVKVSPELVYHKDTLAKLRATLATRRGLTFSVPEFKDWTGVSRKYAIPLLEYFDKERVTRRLADRRMVV